MKLIGADPAPQMEGLDRLPGRSNYIIGRDASGWRRNVESFAKVRYRSVYPGIDLIYYGNQRQIEYDFVVAPGADPNVIRLGFVGLDQVNIDAQGDLVLKTANGEIRQRKPVAYQEVDGIRREITCSYALKDKQEVGFELGEYDHTRPLVIDPVMAYSTYLGGGSDANYPGSIAVDAAGNAYVTGVTYALDFPTSNPLQPNPAGNGDVFVAKLNPEGSALVYSTYLGGGDDRLPFDDDEDPKGIAVDRFGCLYLAGTTASPDFPTANPLKSTLADGDRDAFVTKISADGSAFVYSTYLGGGDFDEAWDLAVDASGAAYVTGKTFSPDFPTVNPLQPVLSGTSDAFVTKISPTGSALLYSTYLGGTRGEWGFGIGIDSRNSIYVTGLTLSDDFPTLDAAQPIPDGSPDIPDNGFVAKLKADGSRLIYSTYLGGRGVDEGDLIAVDARGNAYVFGFTDSDDVPTTPGAIRREPRSPNQHHSECFITKISASRRHHQGHDKDCEDDHDGEGRHSRKARH